MQLQDQSMTKKATVIIPCFNVEEYINECLDSVKKQGRVVEHTYVVDNNSTDRTVSKVLEWKASNPEFQLTVCHEHKSGAPSARNHALKHVKTRWVQFLDADDLLIPKKIAEQISAFPNADVICGGAEIEALDGSRAHTSPASPITLALMKGQAGITSSNLFNTSTLNSVQGWDETKKSSQEYDLMFRMWNAGATFCVDVQQRAVIRARPSGQISTLDKVGNLVRFIELRISMLEVFRSHKAINKVDKEKMQQFLFNSIRQLAAFDLNEANRLYNLAFGKKKFIPHVNSNNSSAYVFSFKLVGFRKAEILKAAMREIFPLR